MRAIPLKAIRIPRIEQQSLFITPRNAQCHCLHTTPALRFPNPYSKRPETFPEPAEKIPEGPATHPEHGLYGFFRAKTSVTSPRILQNHGRPWTAEELRRKSWDDLHVLWYKCMLERNIIATEAQDARRQGIFFAIDDIHKERNSVVKRTMARIKFVLWERYRAWWGAHQLNEQDPLLLDRLKEEERNKRIEKVQEERSKMSKTQLRRLTRKRETQFKRREARREMAKVAADEAKLREQKEAEELAEFQRLAAGGGPEANRPT